MNSVTFLARFNNDDPKIDESFRLVAFFLKKNGAVKKSAMFPNVLASNFGVSLSDFKLETLEDGEYEIAAYAFDGATGSLEQYNLLNSVANGDEGTSPYDIVKNGAVEAGINFRYSYPYKRQWSKGILKLAAWTGRVIFPTCLIFSA